jgi:multisubunit Na+/H+ antiporter MnhE subunit
MADDSSGREQPPAGQPPARRAVTWLTWWVLLMGLWVAVDDSLRPDELAVGAVAAALAALAAELVTSQAGLRLQVKAAWLLRALRLPAQLVVDTWAVYALLAGVLFKRTPPPAGTYQEVPVRYGDDTPLGVTRRVLLVGARSFTPNEFVLGLDPDRDVMVVHQLAEK